MQLVSIEETKEFIGRIGTPDDDQYILALIEGTTAAFEQYLNHSFTSTSYTEYYSSDGWLYELRLPKSPVSSVTSVAVDTGYTWATNLVESTDYVVWTEAGIIEKICSAFISGVRHIKVVYVAGYSTEEVDGEIVIAAPDTVKLACKLQVAETFRKRDHIGAQSFSIESSNVTFPSGALSKEVEMLLDLSRRSPGGY